ncbi:hypothetical protein [Streptomyces sp. NPDC046862]|uniref:hypothetical protein n=1 Tax=Streptomyces sp. NPDC046862 TaxID=3154603 RepID=UPI003453B3D9
MSRTRRTELELASSLLRKVADGKELSPGDSVKAVIAVAAVDSILQPGGWTQLREDEGAFTTNLPLTTRASERDALTKAADMKRRTLSSLVTEGFRKVLAGEWMPPKTTRAGRHDPSDARVVLNVTVEDAVRQQLRDNFSRLAEGLGYRVTEGGTALAFLRYELRNELAAIQKAKKPAAD